MYAGLATTASGCQCFKSLTWVNLATSYRHIVLTSTAPATRADHGIDTRAGDGARTLLCDDQLPPPLGIERSDGPSTETCT